MWKFKVKQMFYANFGTKSSLGNMRAERVVVDVFIAVRQKVVYEFSFGMRYARSPDHILWHGESCGGNPCYWTFRETEKGERKNSQQHTQLAQPARSFAMLIRYHLQLRWTNKTKNKKLLCCSFLPFGDWEERKGNLIWRTQHIVCIAQRNGVGMEMKLSRGEKKGRLEK